MSHGDLLAEATSSIVLPMTAEGVHTMTYNPNPTTSIVEMGKQLLAASRDGLAEDVSQLLARSAPMTTDWLGTSPLHLAAVNGHCSTAEVLMRSGCSGDAKTKVDKTPLHLAATEGHSQMAELLLKSGAEVDSKDMLRMTPLHWSVERGHADCAEVLVRYGADVNFENKFGKCPLELASEHGRSDMYEMLQNAEEIRASMPVSPPPGPPVNPLVSDPVTMAATQSIQSELGFGEAGLMSPPGAGSSGGHQRLLSSSSLLADHFITGASPPPSTDHLASQEEAMKFLEGHGITLLPEDTGPTMMESVISSGRQTLTLTGAGKLALSSSAPSSPVITTSGSPFTLSMTPSTSSQPRAVAVTSIQAVKPAVTPTAKVINVTAAKPPALQTTKSIVINTSNPAQAQTVKTSTIVTSQQQQQPQQVVRKEPRVIKVTKEQFAAIKAGKGTRLTGLGGATPTTSSAVSAAAANRPVIAKALAGSMKAMPNQKTIKIVRLNPNGGTSSNSVQLMPKPVILSSPRATPGVVVASSRTATTTAAAGSNSSTSDAKQAVMKKLKEIQDAKDALERQQEEIMRQLGT